MRIAWSGLADSKYYHHIAKYCLPSWSKLPGDKYIVHDANDISPYDFNVIDWKYTYNRDNKFTQMCRKTKAVNFWRKMQSQIWALKNLVHYDYVVLMDTDVEVLNFNLKEFNLITKNISENNYIWATGQSQLKKLDAGHIVVNMRHSNLNDLIFDYENIWESGKIFELRRFYDGDAVESLFDKYPSYKITNTDHGGGLHTYELGTVHYGSKIPKLLRSQWEGNNSFMIEEIIKQKNFLSENLDILEELKNKAKSCE